MRGLLNSVTQLFRGVKQLICLLCARQICVWGFPWSGCSPGDCLFVQRKKKRRRTEADQLVKVFPGARQGAAGRAGGAADHLHPPVGGQTSASITSFLHLSSGNGEDYSANYLIAVPFKGVLALRSEVVDVRLEVEFEDVVLVDVLRLRRHGDGVSQQRKAGQRVVVLQEDDISDKSNITAT